MSDRSDSVSSRATKDNGLWTPGDLADYLSVKENLIKYWVRNREIPFVRLGRQIRFVPQDVFEWIAAKGNTSRLVDTRELRRV